MEGLLPLLLLIMLYCAICLSFPNKENLKKEDNATKRGMILFCFHSLSSFAFQSLSLLLYILLIFTPIRPIKSFLFAAGWRLPHPTQLEPEPPAAVHSGRALPAEGLQHSHPLPGGDAGLRPRKRGQKD